MLLTSSAGAGTVSVSTHDDHKAPPAAATAASEPASPGHSHGHSHGGHSHGAHRVLSDSEKHPVTAILLTTLSGMAATVGGAIVVIGGAPSPALLGHLLSFAAGIMLYISYADLLPHAMMELGDGDELAAFWQANVWMFVGMALFAVVVMFVPEMHLGDGAAAAATDGGGGGHGHSHGKAPAHTDGTPPPVAAAAAAALVSQSRLLATGVVAAIGISLHNLPEGLIVYNQTIGGICTGDGGGGEGAGGLLGALSLPTNWRSCMSRGLAVTLAIALHNIPEGMAVASPLYASTGSRWQAMKWCILSSLCEPLAAIVFGYAFSAHLTPFIMALLNATVAGIMICLCLIELIPAACEHVSPRVRSVRERACVRACAYFLLRFPYSTCLLARAQSTLPFASLVCPCACCSQAAAVSNIAGQVVMFLSLYAMRSAGVH